MGGKIIFRTILFIFISFYIVSSFFLNITYQIQNGTMLYMRSASMTIRFSLATVTTAPLPGVCISVFTTVILQ